MRHRRPHGEEHAGEVDPDHRVPHVEAHAVGRARVGQAGAGDDGVEPAEGSDHRGRGGVDRRLVADVADGPDGGAAVGDDLGGDVLGGAGAHVDDADGGALRGEASAVARPMPLPPPVTSARRPSRRPVMVLA